MNDTTEKLFKTPVEALVFALSYSLQQLDRPLADRMAAPSPKTGKGLHGIDGAAQAGMIRREMEQLSEIESAVLIARYAPRSEPCNCRIPCCSGYRPNPEWLEAIRVIEQAALGPLAGHLSHYRLRRRLVEKAMGVKVDVSDLAKECGVSEKTAGAHWRIVREWINGKQSAAAAKKAKRARTQFANVDESEQSEAATDGVLSAARKHIDNHLSGLPFIGE